MSDCPGCEIEDQRKRHNLACYRQAAAGNERLKAENVTLLKDLSDRTIECGRLEGKLEAVTDQRDEAQAAARRYF